MTSEEGARALLSEAKDIANCDPDTYHRDFLLAKEGDDDEFSYNSKKVEFHSNILTELNITLTEQLQSLLTDIKEPEESEDIEQTRQILRYDVDNYNHSPSPIQYIDEDDVSHSDLVSDFLNHLTVNDVTDFSVTDDIVCQVFRIKDNFSPDLAAFRIFTKTQIVGSNFRVKVTTFGDKEYNKLEENPVALPEYFDFLHYDGMFFVFNPGNFEKILDHFETYKKDAEEVLKHLEDSNINISDYRGFKSTVQKSNHALRRMRRIRKRGKYKNLNRNTVEQLISDWQLDVGVGENDDGEWEIKLKDLRNVGDILKILDDDLAVSGMDVISDTDNEEKYIVKGGKETLT